MNDFLKYYNLATNMSKDFKFNLTGNRDEYFTNVDHFYNEVDYDKAMKSLMYFLNKEREKDVFPYINKPKENQLNIDLDNLMNLD